MYDKFEKIGKSLIYHGKHNNRVYIMKIFKDDFEKVIERSEELARKNNYTKIFAKVPRDQREALEGKGYELEAIIPKFYQGEEDCLFMGRFLDEGRRVEAKQEIIDSVMVEANKREHIKNLAPLPLEYKIHTLDKDNTIEMANIYKEVFSSYPFPVFDPEYIKETMDDNIEYMGIYKGNKLVSIASAEKYPEYNAVEMTDFATLPDHRGKGLGLYLLEALELKMTQIEKFKTLYTIARAESYSMNITFKKRAYKYCGTLVNNTNISGSIESMNIWMKN